MGDMYNSCSPSSMGGSDHRSSDDLSLFLNQILLRSSSSSSSLPTTSSCSSFVAHKGPRAQSFAAPLSIPRESHPHSSSTLLKEGTSGSDSGDGVNVGYFSGNVRGGARNSVSLPLGGVSENETDEGDCGSEEGLEALIEEVPAKPTPSRSSSKRSRASEVHNLSEKRRRSRINEKMKALQNLIPNSNKTDKASMLDEAIEYLKQLQLQVQMLSMRNGVSLSPMCLPGLLQPIHLSQFSRGFSEENVSQHMNIMGSLPLSQESSEQINYDLVNQCSVSNQLSLCNMSTVINSETSYGTESSIQAHFGPFPHHATSGEIGRKDGLPHQQLNADHSERIPSEFEMAKATASFPLETQAYNLKDGNTLEASVLGRDEGERVFLKNIEHNLILSPSFQGTQAGRSTFSDEIKIERQDI